MERVRRLLVLARENKTLVIGVSAALLCVALGAWMVSWYFRGDTPGSAFSRMYICTEAGKPFRHEDKEGETQPIHSPHSGRNTGVLAEACYWRADGGTKKEATWVLLNSLAGKSEPTFCPDCGRLVVGHNPRPRPGATPPPTEKEYSTREPSR
jgi:hypothetical protein